MHYLQRQRARAAAEEAARLIEARDPASRPSSEAMDIVAYLLGAAEWTFAKSMADNPHWYTLRKTWERDEQFVAVVKFIRAWGYVERFPDPKAGWPYVMLDVAGFKYWTMGARCERGPYGDWPADEILINRKPLPCSSPSDSTEPAAAT